MYLSKLSLINFKNYAEISLEPGLRVNCFTGNNGVGKTNILDAIHYLSLCKSYFHTPDTQIIRHNEPFFVIQGEYVVSGSSENIYCGVKRGAKKNFMRNKKEYERLSEHIGLLPVVMISPSDSALVWEGGEERRRWINEVISQYDVAYLSDLQSYNRVLSQRNALLKKDAESGTMSSELLYVFNEQLTAYGVNIYEKRVEFVKELSPLFQEFYNFISSGNEEVALVYNSALNERTFTEILEESEAKDRYVLYTSCGIHRDDLVFTMQSYPVKRVGSQGQQKTYLTALKLAVYEFMKSRSKVTPILLMDDIFDKFDIHRVKKVLQLVSDNRFGQIFITDTHTDRMSEALDSTGGQAKIFEVSGNNISVLNEA